MMSIGAPGAISIDVDDDPMCKQMIVPSSSHALKNGSQCSPKMCGHPSLNGFSENVTAWQPFLATRRTSSAISWGSQIGGIDRGMNRPGYVPHHSSMCQSL